MTRKSKSFLVVVTIYLLIIPVSKATLVTTIGNETSLGTGSLTMYQSAVGDHGVDDYDLSFLQAPGTQISVYSIRPTDGQSLAIDSRPLPEIGDIYNFSFFAKNNSGSDMTFDNHLSFLTEEYSDILNHDYLLKFDIGKDGIYEFNQVITADQMRAGFSTEAWTQQISDGFSGEYATGSLEVIPEPVSIGLLGLGALFALGANRFQKHFKQ